MLRRLYEQHVKRAAKQGFRPVSFKHFCALVNPPLEA